MREREKERKEGKKGRKEDRRKEKEKRRRKKRKKKRSRHRRTFDPCAHSGMQSNTAAGETGQQFAKELT